MIDPKVGDRVYKLRGYTFVGTIVSVFQTLEYQWRIVVQVDATTSCGGLLHIFEPQQFERLEWLR